MTLSYCNNNSSYPVWYSTSSAARMEPEWGQIQFRLNLNSLCICISHAYSKLSITVRGGATVHKCGVFVFGITSQFMRPESAFPFDNCYGKFLHRWLWRKDFTHGTRICPKWFVSWLNKQWWIRSEWFLYFLSQPWPHLSTSSPAPRMTHWLIKGLFCSQNDVAVKCL